MNDKLFFVNPSIGLRKTYGELLKDVNSIQSIPNVYGASSPYELFATLVAALCGNADLALSQEALGRPADGVISSPDSLRCSAATTIADQCVWSGVTFPDGLLDFPRKIRSSTSKIGVFTSGTTGRPKIIQHRTDTLMRSVKTGDRHRNDVWGLTYYPASFAGLQVFFQAICNSNPIVRLSGLGASAVHEAIRSEGVTHLSATPTWMRLICSDSSVHQRVLSITTGGEITDRSLIQQIKSTFPNAKFRNIYASTESGSLLISDGDSFRVPDDLKDLVMVQDGMLAIHRSLLAESLRDHSQNEFYVTGDYVEIVTNQPLTLRFAARREDWINVGGNKVNPYEVEQLLLTIEGVADARVFGRKNSVTGNIVCCEIVRSEGAEVMQADIRRMLTLQVPAYKLPRIVEFVESIAKTPSGKKSRAE